jgi:hypothetical protein
LILANIKVTDCYEYTIDAHVGEVAMTEEMEEKNSSSSPRLCIFSKPAIMAVPGI